MGQINLEARALPNEKCNIVLLLIKEMRPKQWTKNLLVFAALLFSLGNISLNNVVNSIVGFFLFCFISGCVYILNDFVDREADRQHPEKKHRPMAAGNLNPFLAVGFGGVLFIITLTTAFMLNIAFGSILLFYFILNVVYSFKMKHVVIADIMIIAAGFVLRAVGGGLVINVPFTPWFLLCTMLLALFLAVSKRRHELILLQQDKGSHRKVLQYYSSDLLNQLNSIVTTATIMSYSLFTFTSGRTIHLMLTIPFVIYGIFRYLYLIHMEEKGGRPEKVLLEDKHILITVLLYAISTAAILYWF